MFDQINLCKTCGEPIQISNQRGFQLLPCKCKPPEAPLETVMHVTTVRVAVVLNEDCLEGRIFSKAEVDRAARTLASHTDREINAQFDQLLFGMKRVEEVPKKTAKLLASAK